MTSKAKREAAPQNKETLKDLTSLREIIAALPLLEAVECWLQRGVHLRPPDANQESDAEGKPCTTSTPDHVKETKARDQHQQNTVNISVP